MPCLRVFFQVLDEENKWRFVGWNENILKILLTGFIPYGLIKKEDDCDSLDVMPLFSWYSTCCPEDKEKELIELFGFHSGFDIRMKRDGDTLSLKDYLEDFPEDADVVEDIKGILEKYKDKVYHWGKVKLPLKYPEHIDVESYFKDEDEGTKIFKKDYNAKHCGILVEED